MCLNSRVQKRAFAVLAVEIVFMVIVVVSVLLTAHTHEKRSMIVGILCVIFGAMMYASPLTVMVRERTSIRFCLSLIVRRVVVCLNPSPA